MCASSDPSPQDGMTASTASGRYEALLQQVVQLNTDLQKTAALSQTLQRERDGLQHNNSKLKDEIQRLHARCEKMQLVLMQETEHKIDAEKRHEQLIAKWKTQLELKAKAFEALQQKFAPPRDLEQLRMQIQDELEIPHQQLLAGLQEQVETHRQAAFQLRRDLEVLRATYEQVVVDHQHEMDAMHDMYESRLGVLAKKLAAADESARDTRHLEIIRKLERQKEAADVEIKLLSEEIRELREEAKRAQDHTTAEHREWVERLAEATARCVELDLDHKALSRQNARLKEVCDSLRVKCDQAETQVNERSAEIDQLRDQLKQKEQLVLHAHSSVTTKLRDERERWEREQAALKDRINELSLKLQLAETSLQKLQQNERQRSSEGGEDSDALDAAKRARQQDAEKHRATLAAMEDKLASKAHELQAAMLQAEEDKQRLCDQLEAQQRVVQAMETENAQWKTQHAAAQELVARIKSECILARTKLKETEADYRALQTKHRETLQLHDDLKLEHEQVEAKLKYADDDCLMLREQAEKARLECEHAVIEWQQRVAHIEEQARSRQSALRAETKQALTKVLHELHRAQKKSEAYKSKCLAVHARNKELLDELQCVEDKLAQRQHSHAIELQQVLAQLSDVENDKAVLLQRQLESAGVNDEAARTCAIATAGTTPKASAS